MKINQSWGHGPMMHIPPHVNNVGQTGMINYGVNVQPRTLSDFIKNLGDNEPHHIVIHNSKAG